MEQRKNETELLEPSFVTMMFARKSVTMTCDYAVKVLGEDILQVAQFFRRLDFGEDGFDLLSGWVGGGRGLAAVCCRHGLDDGKFGSWSGSDSQEALLGQVYYLSRGWYSKIDKSR